MFEKLISIFLGLLSFMPGMHARGPLVVGERLPAHLTATTSQGKPYNFPARGIVVLYFYPVSGTTHCTQQACSLRDNFGEFKGFAEIVGVSYDSQEKQEAFKRANRLPFTLLSDTSRNLAHVFGANRTWVLDWAPKRMTFIIKDGILEKIFPDVDIRAHKNQILTEVRALLESK